LPENESHVKPEKRNMKQSKIFAIVLVVLFSINTFAKGPDDSKIKWYSFDEGLKKSIELKKKIIMDVYTDWCVWCKKMDNATYSNLNVVSYLRDNYIAIKLDAESKKKISYQGKELTEQEFSRAVGVTGYPATVFFDNAANLITVVPGYIESKDFLNIITFLGEDIYKSKSYEDYLKSVKK